MASCMASGKPSATPLLYDSPDNVAISIKFVLIDTYFCRKCIWNIACNERSWLVMPQCVCCGLVWFCIYGALSLQRGQFSKFSQRHTIARPLEIVDSISDLYSAPVTAVGHILLYRTALQRHLTVYGWHRVSWSTLAEAEHQAITSTNVA